ncbi:unnamed protein product [Adineta ricciae]|uniref:Uncharacterized protein n=1 Tax=Adineta ricciae TaxID=249248 RepID=A0A813MQT6_ADIRI|nr:unnamed protein product [Adineta ricciae]CAF1230251.1 unnamed protein product [Adineta ricciae]
MSVNQSNQTSIPNLFIHPTVLWCLIMPVVHFLSLISNTLCIIIFCSKTFVHKPIAIYFICLLISDSTTLLIGYSEMLDREAHMMDKSSLLCAFNVKIIHRLTDWIYSFMGKFCIEWMLYKVLWTRASTILLAILSIQRSRTFFSLSYRESRFCALFACLMSILIASFVTCFEWIGVQCNKSSDSHVYLELFQIVMSQKTSKQLYSTYLFNHYDESIGEYSCMMKSLKIYRFNHSIATSNESLCSPTATADEFYLFTQSLLTHPNATIAESMNNILADAYDANYHHRQRSTSLLVNQIEQIGSLEMVIKLFEKRTCNITLFYSVCLRLLNFLYSLSFGFNRHTIAIFFGNALPSMLVFLANLLSLKVIYFSESLKYLKKTTQKNRRKRRLQNDLRAFLVIIIESFSVITISWCIPIFLTMYYCQTLYVISITACPQIKRALAFFLFPDLFNSSTNCLLYSLSGKLFRRKFIGMIKAIFTCGRGLFWGVRKRAALLPTSHFELQASNDPSAAFNNGIYSRTDTCRHSEFFSPVHINKLNNTAKKKKVVEDDGSSCTAKNNDETTGSNGTQVESPRTSRRRRQPQTFKTFLIDKVPFLRSNAPKKNQTIAQKQQLKLTQSFSSTGTNTSNKDSSSRPKSTQQLQSRTIILINPSNNQCVKTDCLFQNVTSL